jgi:tripartite-type tricarboxylate transporter receptor subunit TctC
MRLVVLLLVLAPIPALSQQADGYPSRTIHILVGFTPGAGPTSRRATSRRMSPEAFDKMIRDDVAVFTKIAREANIKAE